MHLRRSVEIGRRDALAETVKIFVLPPLLTLAMVVASLMVFTTYLAQKSLETTYVVKSMQQSGICAICHGGTHTRAAFRLASLR